MKQEDEKEDAFIVGLTDKAAFCKLGWFEQLDASVSAASLADTTGGIMMGWIVGGVWFFIQFGVVMGLTHFFSTAQESFYTTLLKNVIAYDSLLCHNGLQTFYRVFGGGPEFTVKYKIGSIKEPLIPSIMSSRRSCIDIAVHLLFDASRIWMLLSSSPALPCGCLYCVATYLICLFDYGEYVGMYGMYHGPWSVFMLAQSAGIVGAISVMQFLLVLLYIGCGLGKMGPWFVAVFAQEWTLPPWAKYINLRGLLYNKDFPRSNAVTTFGTVVAYVAASAEWIAPLLLLLPVSVVGGAPGSCSKPVACGIAVIIVMHFYIVLHIPNFDVWGLNLVPTFIVYHVFLQSPYLSEPGFDFAGFTALPVLFKAFCFFMAAYCIYGQMFPAKVSYMSCYRFWAGNWPQGTVIVSESGMKKIELNFPAQWAMGKPGEIAEKVMGDLAMFSIYGQFQTAQLPHRIMPRLVHRAMQFAANERGQYFPPTIAEFKFEQNGAFVGASMLSNWVSGFSVNDSLRTIYCIKEMQKVCNFEKGELMLCVGHSFPAFAHLWNGRSEWQILDAAKGVIEEGTITVGEALSITRPSLWHDYRKRGNSLFTKSDGYHLMA